MNEMQAGAAVPKREASGNRHGSNSAWKWGR